jgi:hypothetical protein
MTLPILLIGIPVLVLIIFIVARWRDTGKELAVCILVFVLAISFIIGTCILLAGTGPASLRVTVTNPPQTLEKP